MVWQASSTNANPLNRGKVIEIICRLELVASQLLSQEFKNRNPEYRENLIQKQLFGEMELLVLWVRCQFFCTI